MLTAIFDTHVETVRPTPRPIPKTTLEGWARVELEIVRVRILYVASRKRTELCFADFLSSHTHVYTPPSNERSICYFGKKETLASPFHYHRH